MLAFMSCSDIHHANETDSDGDENDAHSVASFPPFSNTPSIAGSQTSYDVSIRSASPVPSVWSMTSSLRAQAFKQEYGRSMNNYSDVYRIAADDEELDRLDKQHELFTDIIGKYPPPFEHIMADDIPGETKACLDLGCGSGRWIMDVARDFPQCSAVAVDLVPMQSPSMPLNCRSEVDDINLGLEHFYGDFNVVHAQLISSGIKDYASLIDQISRVLRPGGLIDILEFDFHVCDENHKRFELSTHIIEPPWFPRWLTFVYLAAKRNGGDVDAATHIRSWITSHPAFEDVVSRDFWIPTSPWIEGNPTEKRRGEGLRDDIFAFMRSARPLLLGSGLPEALLDELESNSVAELRDTRTRHYVCLQSVYARKKRS